MLNTATFERLPGNPMITIGRSLSGLRLLDLTAEPVWTAAVGAVPYGQRVPPVACAGERRGENLEDKYHNYSIITL